MLRGTGCCLLLAAASACGTSTDDRPATLANITESILKPTCAQAECHSTFKQEKGYDFETVATARVSFAGDPKLVDVDDIGTNVAPVFIQNLTLEQGVGQRRMPYDAPLPNADVDLIQTWLESGLSGICPHGATTACLGTARFLPCVGDDAYDLTHRCSNGPRARSACTTSLSCGGGHCATTTTTTCNSTLDCPKLIIDTTKHEICVGDFTCEIGVPCADGTTCSNGACE